MAIILSVCLIICASINFSRGASLGNTTSLAMAASSVDYNKVPIVEKALHVPDISEIAGVLSNALPETFEEVSVEVVDCPDLTQQPFNLTSPGLSGDAKLLEVGGPPYLLPLVRRDKVYDLAALAKYLGRDPAFLAGAGAGPWPHVGVNCEGIINLSIRGGVVNQGTRAVSVTPVGAAKGSSSYKVERLPNSETRTALLGNYLLSAGEKGKVLKVVARKRVGPSNFITAIREALTKHYGDKVVGLGGTFLLREGKVKHHVMPDFSSTAIHTDAGVDQWLHYFEIPAPIVHVGTLVTGDLDIDLRLQHFHGWGSHGVGGHYHYDTTPDAAAYEGYFSLPSSVIRIDQPQDTHQMGRD